MVKYNNCDQKIVYYKLFIKLCNTDNNVHLLYKKTSGKYNLMKQLMNNMKGIYSTIRE